MISCSRRNISSSNKSDKFSYDWSRTGRAPVCIDHLNMIWLIVTFRITDPTLSLSLPETLRRHIVDHQTLPVVCSLFLSGQFPSWPKSSSAYHMPNHHYPILQHFTCQRTPSNTFIITQHLRLWLHMEQIPYVQFILSHIYFTSPHAHFTYHVFSYI